MDYISLLKEVKKNIQPLYLLYGTEEFFIKDITEKIVTSVLPEQERDFNYSIYDMKEIPVEEAIEEGETLPFFGEKRVILLKNCYFLTGVKDKEKKVEHNLSAFERYAENPAMETIMIAVVPHEKLDERKKVVKKLKKHSVVLEATPFDERRISQWLDEYQRDHHLSIKQQAKEKLLQLAGKDMMMLSSELDKLSLYARQTDEITKDAVEKLVPRTLEDNVFELVDAVVSGRSERALRIYYDLLKQNEEPIKILALLARQFRMILHVIHLKKQGYSRQKMASQLKAHPYAVKVADTHGRKYNSSQLERILKELAEADFEIKTGQMEKSLRLELCLLKLTSV